MAVPAGGDLSREFRRVYEDAGVRQTALARHLGVDQTTISDWALGTALPRVTAFPMIERFCRVPVGTILRRAGYVEPEGDVESALMADTRLTDERRQMLIDAYRALVTRAADDATAEENAPSPATNPAS